MMPKEIVIRCIENQEYHIHGDDLQYWDFDYNQDVLRIDNKNGSFVEFYKRNIIWVKFFK